MDFKIIKDTEKAGYVKFQVRSKIVYTSQFMRIGLLHDSFKINMFAVGIKEVNFLSKLHLNTFIYLKSFQVIRDLSLIKKHLPECLDLESIAFSYSDKDSFLEFSFSNTFYLEYQDSELSIIKGTPLESVDLSLLFGSDHEETSENNSIPDLKQLQSTMPKKTISNYCGVILDCCGSYLKPTSKDYLATFKVTDPSLFPDFLSINIFHKNIDALPKLKNLGDIIYLQFILFSEFQGKMQGTLSASAKQSSFFVFDYEENTCKPYAWYRSQFFRESDVESRINSLKSWVRTSFGDKVKDYLKNNTRPIKEVHPSTEDFDLIGKVVGLGRLGILLSDPFYLHLQLPDDERVYHVTIPKEKTKLLMHVQIGEIIKIRSLFKGFGNFLVSDFSEVLRIRFESMKIAENNRVRESLEKFQMAIGMKVKKGKISMVSEKAWKYPKIVMSVLEGHPDESIFRVKGFLLRVFWDSLFWVIMWDAKDGDKYFKAFVQDEDFLEFMNGFKVEQVNSSKRLSSDVFRCLIKVKSGKYQIISTKLVGF
jgi:hypothetical protein